MTDEIAGKTGDMYLRLSQVRRITGVSSSTLWRWERNGQFPIRRQLGPKVVGWLQSEIVVWMKNRPLAAKGSQMEGQLE